MRGAVQVPETKMRRKPYGTQAGARARRLTAMAMSMALCTLNRLVSTSSAAACTAAALRQYAGAPPARNRPQRQTSRYIQRCARVRTEEIHQTPVTAQAVAHRDGSNNAAMPLPYKHMD